MRNTQIRSKVNRYWPVAGLALAVAFGCGPVQARPFYLMRGLGGARTIIDPAAIEPVLNTSVRQMWTVTVQANIMNETPPQPGYVRALNEYDCAAQKSRWRSFTVFSRSGSILLGRENPNGDWVDATPASGAYAEWRVACGYSRGDSALEADGIAKVVIALMRSFDAAPVARAAPSSIAMRDVASPATKPKPTPPAAKPKAPL
jgi:hypothetical protein